MLGTLLALPVLLATPASVVAAPPAPSGGTVLLEAVRSSRDVPLPLALEATRATTTPVLRRTASALSPALAGADRPCCPGSCAPAAPRRRPRAGHSLSGASRAPPSAPELAVGGAGR
jgi:hypothetical protein